MEKKFALLGLSLFAIQAIACTGFIAGKNATADGYMIHARNEDFGKGVNPKKFIVVKRKNNPKGTLFENPDTGFKIEVPRETFKYTLIPDSDQSAGQFGEAGFNEYGLSVSTTVSASANDEILKYDPYVKGGLTEADMAGLILMQSKTAKEGIKLIAKIIEEKGAGEGNTFVIADKEEMWYMEIYTGHQYTAVKVPDDAYAVLPNAFYLGSYDFNSKDVIASKNIEKLPKEHNLAQEKDGKFHLALTYREKHSPYNAVRMYMGQNYFSASNPVKYDENIAYDVFRKPDKKIEVKDVMNFMRYRYENSEFDARKPENCEVRVIGTEKNLESHIFQMKKDAPSVMWLAMGTVEHSVFIPYYEYITKTPEYYTVDADSFNPKSMYWTFKQLHILARNNRELASNGVKKYFSEQEAEFIKEVKNEEKIFNGLSMSKKEKLANEFAKKRADIAKKDADKMYSDLLYYQGNITELMKSEPKPFEFKK